MLPEIIRGAAARFGDRHAFVSPDGSVTTYTELDQRSDALAAGLHGVGVREGDVVALVLPSTVDYIASYLGAAKLGAITAGVNPRYTEVERKAVLEVARPAIVIDSDDVSKVATKGDPPCAVA